MNSLVNQYLLCICNYCSIKFSEEFIAIDARPHRIYAIYKSGDRRASAYESVLRRGTTSPIKYASASSVTGMVILLTGSKITTQETKKRIMHHLKNFSISCGVRVGPTRAPPRGESVAPLSIIRASLSGVARRPARPRGWRPPRHRRPPRLGDLCRALVKRGPRRLYH